MPAEPVEQVADVTGAGDLFAAGFLAGLARGKDHRTSARLGGLAAAEVIQHIGAPPGRFAQGAGGRKRDRGLPLQVPIVGGFKREMPA